jgi:hypothetical protein
MRHVTTKPIVRQVSSRLCWDLEVSDKTLAKDQWQGGKADLKPLCRAQLAQYGNCLSDDCESGSYVNATSSLTAY